MCPDLELVRTSIPTVLAVEKAGLLFQAARPLSPVRSRRKQAGIFHHYYLAEDPLLTCLPTSDPSNAQPGLTVHVLGELGEERGNVRTGWGQLQVPLEAGFAAHSLLATPGEHAPGEHCTAVLLL